MDPLMLAANIFLILTDAQTIIPVPQGTHHVISTASKDHNDFPELSRALKFDGKTAGI